MAETPALTFVRRLARSEAQQLGSELVEPEHLLIGLCKVGDRELASQLAQQCHSQRERDRAQAEVAGLLHLLALFQLEPVRLRREVRSQLPQIEKRVMPHRSLRSHQLCEAADKLAQQSDRQTAVLHLLAALCLEPSPTIDATLKTFRMLPSTLAAQALATLQNDTFGTVGAIRERSAATEQSVAFERQRGNQLQLEQAHRHLLALYQINKAISAASASEQLLDVIAREVQLAIPRAQRGAILTVEEGGQLVTRASWPNEPLSLSSSWAERARREQEAFIWFANAPRATTVPPSASKAQVQAAIYAPLIYAQRAWGVLYVDSSASPNAFSTDDLQLLSAIAAQAAIALYNQELRSDQERMVAIRSNLLRYFAPADVELLISRYGHQTETPAWSMPASVVAIRLHAPTAHLRVYQQILNELAALLLQRGAAVIKDAYSETLLAVFGTVSNVQERAVQALEAAWSLHRYGLPPGWVITSAIDDGPLAQGLGVATPVLAPDQFSSYEAGLQVARAQFLASHPAYHELLIFEQRLRENISQARLFGSSDTLAHERRRVIHDLNRLLQEHLGHSLNDLVQMPDERSPLRSALLPIEYRITGEVVQRAINLAQAAAAGTLLAGIGAYALLNGRCTLLPHPHLSAYIVATPEL